MYNAFLIISFYQEDVLERENRFLEDYREASRALREFYEGDADIGEKLSKAVGRGDAEEAERFIAEGADVNLLRPNQLPLIHEATGLGHKRIVDAMLATGRCDLTVRDFRGRLPSDIAGAIAGDYELAERLAGKQAVQFRAKEIDPRRPQNPDYGNWVWQP